MDCSLPHRVAALDAVPCQMKGHALCARQQRTRGSHHVFRRDGIEERINLQRDGGKARPYQVRQVRAVLVRHKLETGE